MEVALKCLEEVFDMKQRAGRRGGGRWQRDCDAMAAVAELIGGSKMRRAGGEDEEKGGGLTMRWM
jgi:hypothetical protein